MEAEQSVENDSPMDLLSELTARLDKYTSVLKAAEDEGNGSKARRYTRIVKQYKDAITLHKRGKAVPLDELPNPPGFGPLVKKTTLELPDSGGGMTPSPQLSPVPERRLDVSPRPNRKRDISPNPVGRTGGSPMPPRKIATEHVQSADEAEEVSETTINILLNDEALAEEEPPPPPVCSITEENVVEELTARLEVYKNVHKTAQDEGNNSKARRYNRIIKQYTDAIALAKKGRAVPLDELPNPPGFGPLVAPKSAPPSPVPSRPSTPLIQEDSGDTAPNENSSKNSLSPIVPKLPVKTVTRSDKQTALLRERQREYREAALAAKREGQMQQAKEYLKLCKGFDRLIEASESGLPVDLSTIPVSLKAKKETEEAFHVVSNNDFIDADESELYTNLEKELTDQIKTCMAMRNHFKMSADIASANRFEQFALQFKKDLNFVKANHLNRAPIPKFHYETKTFSKILCNTDLSDNELELTIMQGINYKVNNPNDVDTYVTYEFPYPSSSPPSGRTSTVKNTNNPTYNARYVFPIHREISACQRVFKRHGIKMEVWSKGGFFRSDTSLGTVVVKLMPLNSDIIIHDAFDLMNGRRAAGGKLEIKVRVREPIVSKKIESVSERWLIIDHN